MITPGEVSKNGSYELFNLGFSLEDIYEFMKNIIEYKDQGYTDFKLELAKDSVVPVENGEYEKWNTLVCNFKKGRNWKYIAVGHPSTIPIERA